jgi:dCMP deaminase
MNDRPTIPEVMIGIAKLMAGRSTCSARAKVGAVLTRENRILATGHNGAPSGMPHCDDTGCIKDKDGHCVVSIHAEENIIIQCAINGVSTKGSTLYLTHSPCVKCAMKIIQAGIVQVVYVEKYGSQNDFRFVLTSFIASGVYLEQYGDW